MAEKLSPRDRYHVDVSFRQLVDIMEHYLYTCQYTPTEMREAAILAAIHYETKRGPSLIVIEENMTVNEFLGRTEFTEEEKRQAKLKEMDRRFRELNNLHSYLNPEG